jgi:phage shock protein C
LLLPFIHQCKEEPMSMSDELAKLDELHRRGALTDDEFGRAKARLLESPGVPGPVPALAGLNALRRSRADRWVAGVCGGIGRFTGVESWIWRLLLVVLALFGGSGLLLYALLWIFVPSE